MGTYEVEINEVEEGLFVGTVIFVDDDGRRETIGFTKGSGMKPKVEELATEIATRHKDGPETRQLDI
jgi:hypothetical protein